MCEYCKMHIWAYVGDEVMVSIGVNYCPVCGERLKDLPAFSWVPHSYIDIAELKENIDTTNLSDNAKERFKDIIDWSDKKITVMSPSKYVKHNFFHLNDRRWEGSEYA